MAQPQIQDTTKPRTVKIRMKPGAGKMLIGRKWRLSSGELSDTLPADMQERQNAEDQWLEARGIDSNGQPTDGPVAEVPEPAIRKFLNSKGQPSRIIDGYKMVKTLGQLQDSGGDSTSRAEWSPARDQGAFDDSTFEILRD
jgi:hypothetical protein